MQLGTISICRRPFAVFTCWLCALVVTGSLPRSSVAADASSENTAKSNNRVPKVAQAQSGSRPTVANGEPGTIEGRISNLGTGGYVGNARISVAGTSLEAFTNSFGFYRLTGVPSGQVELRIFYTGQLQLTKSVSVQPGQIVQADFNFGEPREGDKNIVELSAFSVVARKETDARAIAINEQRFAPNIKNVVSTDEYGSIAEGNVGEFIRFIPGVNVVYDAADPRSISLRGVPAEYTNITIDGNSVASAASSAVTRTVELEHISTNALSRVEVIKVPTPDLPASSLGGSVNLISRSAFEHSRRSLKYSLALSGNSERMTLNKTYGPGPDSSVKIMPNVEFNFVHPVNKNFGYTVNGMYSKQFVVQYNVAPTWIPNNTGEANIPVTNPYLRVVDIQNSVKETVRRAISTRFDWRVAKSHVLSPGLQYNTYSTHFDGNNLFFETGTAPTAWGPTFTQGRAGQGLVRFTGNRRHKSGEMFMPSFNYRFEGLNWKADAAAFYSQSVGRYRDISEGHNNNFNIRLLNQTVRFDDITSPTSLRVSSNTDFTKLENYRLLSANQSVEDATDVVRGAKLNVTRPLPHLPLAFKAGVLVDQKIRDIHEDGRTRTYLGPDGIANTADNTAGPFVNAPRTAEPTPYGLPRVEWPSVYLTAQRFYSNPEQFQEDPVALIQAYAQASVYLKETISAAYFRGDAKLMENRLSLVFGGRYEKTKDYGEGPLVDPTAIWQRNPNGSFVRNAAGNRVAVTTDPVAQARLINQVRANIVNNKYSGFYPSFNASYTVRDNLYVRMGYARTIGRPNFSNIVPRTTVTGPGENSTFPNGRLQVNNIGLSPWTANSVDLSVEYYLNPTGVVSAGIYRKDFKNFFNSITFTPSDGELAELGMDPAIYSGYDVTTMRNGGDAQLSGIDLNYFQALTFLPAWAKGTSIFANATFVERNGERGADFTNFAKRIVNWGFRYNARRISAHLRWNYRGLQHVAARTGANIPPNTDEFLEPRLQLDADVAYAIRPNLSIYAAGRNINEGRQLSLRYAPGTPDYARVSSWRDYGVLITLGVKGEF